MVSALTQDIKVSVQNFFKTEFSDFRNNEFLFVYNISIENLGDAPVQLISRYWHITDALGNERVVEGDGVVGQQPIIAPGESHIYSSSCHLTTPYGTMEGYYLFIKLPEEIQFRARIPMFQMEVPFLLS